jgi:hypothetical protein
MRLRRDTNGRAQWLDVSLTESDDEEENYANTIANIRSLDDSVMTIGGNWQWREALLYNLGTSILPDGPDALAEFTLAWNRSLQNMQGFGFPVAAPHDGTTPHGAPP